MKLFFLFGAGRKQFSLMVFGVMSVVVLSLLPHISQAYSADAVETTYTDDVGTWADVGLQMEVDISGNLATFTVHKINSDGTASSFSGDGELYLNVGSGSSTGAYHGRDQVTAGETEASFYESFCLYDASQYPKAYYARFESDDGGYEVVGPITVSYDDPVSSSLATPIAPTVTTVSSSSLEINWSAVSGASEYRLYRSTEADGTYSQVYWGTATTYTDSGSHLSADTTYYYKVVAGDSSSWTEATCSSNGSGVTESSSAPDLKIPLTAGNALITVQPGGTSMWSGWTDKYHMGAHYYSIDFDDRCAGDYVLAAAGGTVSTVTKDSCRQCTMVTNDNGTPADTEDDYTECADSGVDCKIMIDHGNGYSTLYRHMQAGSITLNEGDSVVQGEKLGVIGTTGLSYGTHLHFEILYNNDSSVDNEGLLGMELDGVALSACYAGTRYTSTNELSDATLESSRCTLSRADMCTETTGTQNDYEISATDSDGDGLDDADELTIGSDPYTIDTDTYVDPSVDDVSCTSADTETDGDPTCADTDDSDCDGLEDSTETAIGTDPNDTDTDDDGLTDGWEVSNGESPTLADGDGDSLLDGEEITLGTMTGYYDSDYDSLWDGDEVDEYSTDPLDTDSDDDGVEDGDEVDSETDPNDADSDDDGINDGEDAYPLVPAGEIELILGSSDGVANYGSRVAIDGDVVVVSSTRDDPTDTWGSFPDLGTVYVYRWDDSQWNVEAELTGEDTYDFGHSLALDGDVLVIGGDSRSDYNYGAAYVYRFDGTTWNEEVTLTPSVAQSGDGFSYTVAVDDDAIAVGANGYTGDYYYNNHGYIDVGAVYTFRYDGTTWNQEAQIVGTDTNSDQTLETDLTNPAIALSGDVLVVGDHNYNQDGDADEEGGAYVYRWSGTSWALDTTLTASDGGPMDYFGSAVAIEGDELVVGAPGDGADTGVSAGSVYMYSYDGAAWNETSKLVASDPADYDYFGTTVDISDELLVIGAPSEVSGVVDTGKAYTFRWDGEAWTEEEEFTASDSADADYYGTPVAVSGELVLVSTGGDGEAVYIYSRPDPDDDNDGLSDDDETSYGTDPNNADTDGDTLTDGYEVDAGLSPTLTDTDSDTLTDADEVALGTNPRLADEDSDDLSDPDELAIGTNSNDADSDDDNLDDGAEVNSYGSDPLSADTDSDGLDDGAEVNMGEASAQATGDGTSDLFGSSVALDGELAIVGAFTDNSAYIYRFDGSTWGRETRLIASDGAAGDNYGMAVAMDGDVAVVGATHADSSVTDAGAAYVYRYDGSSWNQEAKLTPSNPTASYDLFGSAVAVSGDTIAVAGPYNRGSVAHGGAVYVYEWDGSTWNESQIVVRADNSTEGYFADDVALDGNYLVVGAIDPYWSSGAAYVYRYNGVQWAEQATLTPSDGRVSGNDVAIAGDAVVVGATTSDATTAGEVIVYRRSGATWSEQAILTASDGAVNQSFGEGVSVAGSVIVVGSPQWSNDGETDNGDLAYVYSYDGTTWAATTTLVADHDSGGADSFGAAVAASGNQALIGALSDDESATDAGSVFWYDITTPTNVLNADTDGDSVSDAAEITAGTNPADTDTDGDGITDDSDAEPVVAQDGDADGVSDGDDTCPSTTLPLDSGDIIDEYGCAVPEHDADSDGVGDSEDLCADTIPLAESDTVDETGCALSQIDSDEDSLTDYDELIVYGTDSADSDSDDDGLTDYDEVMTHSTDPTDSDSDDDGLTDHEELGSGTANEVFASDGNADDYFGSTVAVSGDVFVVGSPSHSGGGAAYVYRFDGSSWNQEAKLTGSDISNGDYFGYTVAISDDVIVVGSIYNNVSGAAYVYRYSGSSWSQQAKLTASDRSGWSDYFSIGLAVDSDTIVVGASPRNSDNTSTSGAAYVYRYSGSSWSQQAKLTPSDGVADDYFGYGVDVDADTILVGAHGHDSGGMDYSGAAYVYRYDGSTWNEEAQLSASDGGTSQYYGWKVAVSGDVALIGTSNADKAYVYRYDGSMWNEETIFEDDGQTFGVAVAIDEDLALVGGYTHYTGTDGGLARLYRYDGTDWVEQQEYIAHDTAVGDYYGYGVSVDGTNIVIGARQDDDQATNAGSAYAYTAVYYPDATDPNDADTDDDTLLDGSDPDPLVPADTDGDDVPDTADACAATVVQGEADTVDEVGCALSDTDTDNDSYNDYVEFIQGYDPNNIDYVVTKTADTNDGSCSSDCSLREAIQAANTNTATSEVIIDFDIPNTDTGCTAAGICTITPASVLPTLTRGGITINGYTQTGASAYTTEYPAALDSDLTVVLNGAAAGANVRGLIIRSSTNTIQGLVINQFSKNGIEISSGSANIITGCFIGTDSTGTSDAGNTVSGIYLAIAATDTQVTRNLIAGNNATGVIAGTSTHVFGNFIGTSRDGLSDLGNSVYGVSMSGSANIIGTDGDEQDDAAEGNLISGNDSSGIYTAITATSNRIAGNLIGTNIAGTSAIANSISGIYTAGTNTIVGTNGDGVGDANEGNVISGNTKHGIQMNNGTGTSIAGNTIGLDALANSLPNRNNGIYIIKGANRIGSNLDGVSDELETNVIAYNGQKGIYLYSANTTGNLIRRNSLYSNTGAGITLSGGANSSKTAPAISSGVVSGSIVTITGTASSGDSIEVFVASTDNEGQTYVDTTTADSAGNWTITTSTEQVPSGTKVVATATDSINGSSAFSVNRTVW